jgi:predicted membrane channel-forming protein YqfA (hemolysin III family)
MMVPSQYKKSIETQELQLSSSNKLSHYGIVLFLSAMCLLIVFLLLKDKFQRPAFKAEISVAVLLGVLAVVSYRVQKKRLKFSVVDTNLPKDKIITLAEEVGAQLGWIPFLLMRIQ